MQNPEPSATHPACGLTRRELLAAAALVPLPLALPAEANTGPLRIEDFFRIPVASGLRLSPAGTHVALIRPHNGRDNVVVVDLATMKPLIITNFNDADVWWVEWANADRLLLGFADRGRGSGDQIFGGLHSIKRDGADYRTLAERSMLSEGARLLPYGTSFLARVTDKDGLPTDEIIAETPRAQGRGLYDSMLYRVNVATGQFRAVDLSGAPGSVVRWVLDRDAVPRVALSVDKDGHSTLHHRAAAGAPWRVLLGFKADEPEKAVAPIDFDRAGKLYVNAYAGKDHEGVYLLDTESGKLSAEPVVAVKGFDIGSELVFSRGGQRLVGVHFDADRPMSVWFDEQIAAVQEGIDKALPGMFNRLQVASDAAGKVTVLVRSYSDQEPGRFYIHEPAARRTLGIGASRPWITAARMRPTRFFRYDTADGLSIPAQLTLPEGSGPFPLVALHYGGPWVRAIDRGFDPVVQFLASRGYAVFMPAPRASTGFGLRHFKAGWKQWGLGMQDDVTVGVRKLVADGIADPKRLAIAGASYGGYLTMMALVKDPELYRCGVNWVGVTDPSFMFSVTWSDFNRAERGRYSMERLIGDPEKDREQFERTSPLRRAAEIRRPVLMAYGALDQRVPLVHGERMRDALRSHGKTFEWVLYPDEGHGWLRQENQHDFWNRVERFFAQHLKA